MASQLPRQKQVAANRNGKKPLQDKRKQEKNYLSPLGEKIFLDRYAWKDGSKETLATGDTVIVCVDEATRQREIAMVETLDRDAGYATVRLRDDSTKRVAIEHIDKPLEVTPGQTMARIAKGIAQVEPDEKREEWEANFRWLLEDWKFVPGGRIWAGAGTDQNLTYYNCMPPEQEVLTADGYKPIAEVNVGDLVVTHRNRLRPVLHKFERETEEPLYIIKAKKVGYDALRLTGEHKVLAIRSEWVNKHKSRDGLRLREDAQWIPAKELKVGDFVAVAYDGAQNAAPTIFVSDYLTNATEVEEPALALAYEIHEGRLFKPQQRSDYHGHLEAGGTKHSVTDQLEIDHELCYLFGRWLGDGCVTHRSGTDIPSGIKIVFGLDEKEAADHLANVIEAKFGVPASVKVSNTERWYDLWANSMPLGEFFKAFLGCYSYGKRIPEVLMRLPDELTLELLRGLFEADGYLSGNNIGILLANRELSIQAHQLLLRLGYFFSIFENTHTHARHESYRLSAAANECGPLFQYFFKQEPVPNSMDLKYYFEHDGLRWIRITDIAVEAYAGQVLDIEVDEDHSFVSAGLVVSNCYVIPSPRDSRAGIVQTLQQMMEIMSRGGGVGINVSSLRPRYGYVRGVNGRSSGAVSWGGLYSFVTGLIEQGGSRRGALMLICNDWHPDVLEFINSKREMGKITNANISVGISDAFMEAVKADGDWDLVFPDTGVEGYDELWDGDLEAWKAAGHPVVRHKTVKAREMWTQIIESAWASAEPGLWFRERANKMSNSWYFSRLICTNPCHSARNLVHTSEGLVPIRDLVGKEFNVLSDLRVLGGEGVHYERAQAYPTGIKRLFRVTLDNGVSIELTENHRVFTERGKVEVRHLRVGEDAVWVQPATTVYGAAAALAYAGGSVSGSTDSGDVESVPLVATVKAIEPLGVEPVYNVTTDISHSLVVNGMVVANCGEQPLPAFGICNLGAINLSRFVEDGQVDWPLLGKTVRYAVRFLDDVIDGTPYFFEENAKQQLSERRVGLGVMGLAEMMIRLELRYGSPEGNEFLDELFKFIAVEAYSASSDYAVEKGAFSRFDADKFLESGFMQGMPEEVRERIREQGIRNVTLLTIAPTGCVAPDTLVSTASGLRPIIELGDPQGEKWQIRTDKVYTDEGLRSTSHFFINGYGTVRKITTKRGFNLTATLNHRVRVLDEQGDYVWRRMDELHIGDRVVLKKGTLGEGETVRLTPVERGINSLSELPETMTPAFAELLGLYMGDGYLKEKGGIHLVVSQDDPDLLEHLKALLQQIWGERHIAIEERIGCWTVSLNGRYISRFFEANDLAKPKGNRGEGAAGAFIPQKVLQAGKECVVAFLRGLFESDGSIHRGTVTLVSTSHTLVHQAQVALLALGVVATVREMPDSTGRFGKRPRYELRMLNRRETEKFVREVGFLSQRKQARSAELGALSDRGDSIALPVLCNEFYAHSKGLRNEVRQTIIQRASNGALTQHFVKEMAGDHAQLLDSRLAKLVEMDIFVDEVAAVEEGFCHTYDLSVPDNHTYIANGFVSHNTTGTMVGTSTGIEPYYFWSYFRKSRLGTHEEVVDVVQEYRDAHPGEELPDYFVTAMDLTPEEHVRVQAVAQRWIDSSISKTSNVPNEYTVEQTAELYQLMYELGCKGGTIYRDGSRDEQVLNLKADEKKEEPEAAAPTVTVEATPASPVTPNYTERGEHKRPRPRRLKGATYFVRTPVGKAYVTVNRNGNDQPFEVFANVGKVGSEGAAMSEAIGRLISLILRLPSDISATERLEMVVEQMEGIGGARSIGFGANRVSSLPDALAQVLREDLEAQREQEAEYLLGTAEPEPQQLELLAATLRADLCPECGHASFVRVEGCKKCYSCGHSEC